MLPTRRRRLHLETLEERRVLSSVTVLTHGATIGLLPDPMGDLADDVYAYWDAQSPHQASLFQYEPGAADLRLVEGSANGENKVILFDWATESFHLQPGYDEAAGDALFAMLVSNHLLDSDYLHLIGHSRGTIVNSEAAQRLLDAGYVIDQMTLLDSETGPAPLNAAGTAQAWAGIGYVDNYWGDGDTVPFIGTVQGERVNGAYNLDLAIDDQGDLNGDGRVGHSEVVDWYASTVTDTQSTEGFNWRKDTINRPAEDGPRSALVDPPGVVNGDFSYVDGFFGRDMAGWSFHGGYGVGDLQISGAEQFLNLGFLAPGRTHNRLVIPPGATQLEYRVWVTEPSINDQFNVWIGDQLVESFALQPSASPEARFSGWETRRVNIDGSLRGTVQTIRFDIDSPGFFNWTDSNVRIDDIRFVEQPVAAVNLTLSTDQSSYVPGQLANVRVQLDDGAPILGASVLLTIEPPFSVGSLVGQTTLFDDGQHNDGAAGDGIYGNDVLLADAAGSFTLQALPETYTLRALVSGMANGGYHFERAPSLQTQVISGIATNSNVEIEVSHDGLPIVNGAGSVDFGQAAPGAPSPEQTFTITNTGSAALALGGIALPAGFGLVSGPAGSVAAGGSTDFTVRLETDLAGAKGGQVSFATNDTDENPFSFGVSGLVSTPGVSALALPSFNWTNNLYLDVLGRVASAVEIAFWQAQLALGVPSSQIVQNFVNSQEHWDAVINSLYLQFLNRPGDRLGLDYWRSIWESSGGPEQVQAGIIASEEFYQSAGGTGEAWVNAVYQNLLGRGADVTDVNYWVHVADTAGAANVVLGFVRSDEFRGGLIASWYHELLGREVDQDATQFWLNAMQNGITQAAVQIAILASDEYRARF